MKRPVRRAILSVLVGCVAVAGSTKTFAYDSENAVPLTITADLGAVSITQMAITLDGRNVAIRSLLRNETDSRQSVTFYASTPVFGQLGDGEEHLDKSFSDIAVAVNNTPVRISKFLRSYFRGHDITGILAKAKLGPLPDVNADPAKLARLPTIEGDKPFDWQASATYSWSSQLMPGSTAVHVVNYRALPQFSLEELESPQMEERVRRHCGNPGEVRERLKSLGAGQQVLVERYEVPLPYMAMRSVELSVKQPTRNWLGARPVMTLVCGVHGGIHGSQPSISGTLPAAEQTLSVLVISMPLPANQQQ
ncbi:hypothetical protein [Massilia sp. METH4]|uniref:hypothetical protein n=1 Tax=Massilia sp. METH4 TaxID=3123041 RepID=UPI0030CF330A